MDMIQYVKDNFRELFRSQEFCNLSDEQLKLGYMDAKEYFERFKAGEEETVNPELTKEEAFVKYKKTLEVLEEELSKRNIDKDFIIVTHKSDGTRTAV